MVILETYNISAISWNSQLQPMSAKLIWGARVIEIGGDTKRHYRYWRETRKPTRGVLIVREKFRKSNNIYINMVVTAKVEGFEAFMTEAEKHKGKTIIALFSGSVGKDGKSWCPDCVTGKSLYYRPVTAL